MWNLFRFMMFLLKCRIIHEFVWIVAFHERMVYKAFCVCFNLNSINWVTSIIRPTYCHLATLLTVFSHASSHELRYMYELNNWTSILLIGSIFWVGIEMIFRMILSQNSWFFCSWSWDAFSSQNEVWVYWFNQAKSWRRVEILLQWCYLKMLWELFLR